MTPSSELTRLGRISAASSRGIFGRVHRILAWPLCDNIALFCPHHENIHGGVGEAGKWFPLLVQISLQTYSERLWLWVAGGEKHAVSIRQLVWDNTIPLPKGSDVHPLPPCPQQPGSPGGAGGWCCACRELLRDQQQLRRNLRSLQWWQSASCHLWPQENIPYSFPFTSADFPKLITWTGSKVFRTDLSLWSDISSIQQGEDCALCVCLRDSGCPSGPEKCVWEPYDAPSSIAEKHSWTNCQNMGL